MQGSITEDSGASAQEIELLAPAGSFQTALSAFAAGADAVYLGLDAFSARAEAVNFSAEELRDLLAYARSFSPRKRVYVTFNTLLDDAQLPTAVEKLALLDELRPDGIIVQDLGVARLARRYFPHLPLHASTQLVAHNLEGVLALRELGFTRVVLARETPLADIRTIAQRCGCELEVFVHGALCYSISGLCLFSAMEKNRSGNRGKCAYCCRLAYTDAAGERSLPFSMRDLRLDDSLDALKAAGVASLKIEGRMKSPLYVATVTRRYRDLLDGVTPSVTRADLETVFSRRTTRLYADGYPDSQTLNSVIDPTSLGHLGTPIGTVKRVTKDREGRSWLRLHTSRALERHDGLQFLSPGSKPAGFGISDMRTAISRSTVFSVKAGTDVEILVPSADPHAPDPLAQALKPGATVFCSASNEVKRRFPIPPFRPSDYPMGTPVDVTVVLAEDHLTASTPSGETVTVGALALTPAQNPERTEGAVRKAFSRLGGTGWQLGSLSLEDPLKLFAPASALNDLRRALVEELDRARQSANAARIAAVKEELAQTPPARSYSPVRSLKLRLDQSLPEDVCEYDELVLALGRHSGKEAEARLNAIAAQIRAMAEEAGDSAPLLRLALPVFTREGDFARLRATVKHLVKAGVSCWEAADLATLRLLTQLGLADITADWTLYALNREAIAQLAELGIGRIVASPENSRENLDWLADNGLLEVEFLESQSTPLFISVTRPATPDPSLLTGIKGDTFTCHEIDGLWVTTRTSPTNFHIPNSVHSSRMDLSWST